MVVPRLPSRVDWPSAIKRGKARLTSRDVVPRDPVTYRSCYRSRSWRRPAIMEEFIRRPAAAQPLGSRDYIRAVAYKPAQVFAGAIFIKLLHILRTDCHLR